jgi:hypothetical protein
MKPSHLWAKIVGFLAFVAATVLGGFALTKAWAGKSEFGKVQSPTPWIRDPENPSKIHVFPSGGKVPIPVSLPVGINASQVRAVEYKSPGTPATVEVNHVPIDRRAPVDPGRV